MAIDILKIMASENPITGPSDNEAPITVKMQKITLTTISAVALSPNRYPVAFMP